MAEVYLLLGSNMGDRTENLLKATALIEGKCGAVTRKSGCYETEAWGLKEQEPFINQCVAINTTLLPVALLSILKNIEKQVGRTDTVKWGPRIIDIDILFYSHQIVDLPELKVPHPHLQERRFALTPLKEVAPDFVHPVFGKTVSELLEVCKDEGEVTALK